MYINHLNYADNKGKVFCKKRVKVLPVKELECSNCHMYRGSIQGEGVECEWNDKREHNQIGLRVVKDPYKEYEYNKNLFKKSSNHSKITGDFTEHLVLYWLSKNGYEAARVDHTGIDLIARKENEVLGISVKSRSRLPGQEKQAPHFRKKHFEKIDKACEDFKCIPYIAFVIDMPSELYMFMISKETLINRYKKTGASINWSMTPKMIEEYIKDPNIEVMKTDYTFY